MIVKLYPKRKQNTNLLNVLGDYGTFLQSHVQVL